MRLFSFRAFSYDVHFHSMPSLITPIFIPLPSLTTLIFIPRLLLRRLLSIHSYCTYFYFAHSPNTLSFIISLCKYQHELSKCLEQLEPFPLPSLVGGAARPPVLQPKTARGAAPLPTLGRIIPPPLIRISPHPRHAPSCLDK